MSAKGRLISAGLLALACGVWGCAPGEVEFAARGSEFEVPEGCVLRKADSPNTLVCALPGSDTHDRLFTLKSDFGDASAADRAGHAQSGPAYWTGIKREDNSRKARKIGTVASERYTVVDPGPRNATACLRSRIAFSGPTKYGDVAILDCLFYDEGQGDLVWTTLEYAEGRRGPSPTTPGFDREAEAIFSTFRFVEPPAPA